MKQRIVFAALAAIAIFAPASAEPVRIAQSVAPGVLPPYEILTIVRSTRLDPLSPPVRRGAHYVLHAARRDGREVRVVVHARFGDILSVTPVVPERRTAAGGPPTGPFDSVGPRYIAPGARDIDEEAPPIVYEVGPPIVYGPRPPADVPLTAPYGADDEPPTVIRATPPGGVSAPPSPQPRVATAPADRERALLPPPPDRFPQRAPAASGKHGSANRVAAMPKQPPLPKPRPPTSVDASPIPPAAPENRPDAAQVPN